jgi:colanic acid/amylovoran biosynthesis glycosyltransferase
MGVDIKKYCGHRREHSSNGKIKILTIARFVEKKGIRFGIEAVGRIVNEHPEIDYEIIGDGILRGEVEAAVDDMKLRDKVKLLGWKSQEEILDFLRKSDILLAPSVTGKDGDQEGIPVVLMEAMALGVTVVSTYHSGIPELVRDGVSGFLAPERDVEALAGKLRQCIEHRDSWPAINKEANDVIARFYDVDRLNDQLVDVYKKLHDH